MATIEARHVTLDELRAAFPGATDDELQARLADLNRSPEIAGLVVDAIALVERGANLTMWRARKSAKEIAKMDPTAITPELAASLIQLLTTAIDNLTAVRSAVQSRTAGESGAPETVDAGLPSDIEELIMGEVATLRAACEEYGTQPERGADGEPEAAADPAASADPAEPAKAEGGDDGGEPDPAAVEPAPAATKAGELLAEIERDRLAMIGDLIGELLAGGMEPEDVRAKISALHEALWKLDASVLTKSADVAKTAHEAVDGLAGLRGEFEAFKAETDKWAAGVEKMLRSLAGVTE